MCSVCCPRWCYRARAVLGYVVNGDAVQCRLLESGMEDSLSIHFDLDGAALALSYDTEAVSCSLYPQPVWILLHRPGTPHPSIFARPLCVVVPSPATGLE